MKSRGDVTLRAGEPCEKQFSSFDVYLFDLWFDCASFLNEHEKNSSTSSISISRSLLNSERETKVVIPRLGNESNNAMTTGIILLGRSNRNNKVLMNRVGTAWAVELSG
ncbi:hypothetical protein Poly51_20170 [Rubripirellula tenax]|uniref:Uncharacterized protein n=1 Tax=Rubripirellula tenax TaxID=2528015 RepID=A0A5C6FHX2_9BACT|nr:hypothetical protein [Rubripirellula tenax]TWU59231.1 hypothetical protein Poly51_20170 [Rubripirellula tenax]